MNSEIISALISAMATIVAAVIGGWVAIKIKDMELGVKEKKTGEPLTQDKKQAVHWLWGIAGAVIGAGLVLGILAFLNQPTQTVSTATTFDTPTTTPILPSTYPMETSTNKATEEVLTIIPMPAGETEGIGYEEVTGPREISEIFILDTQSSDVETEIQGLIEYHVAYHYLIDPSGQVILLVGENDIAYHTRDRNSNSIGIGLIHISGGEKYPEPQLESLVYLLADIVGRHDIKLNKIQIDPEKQSDLPIILSEILEKVQDKIQQTS